MNTYEYHAAGRNPKDLSAQLQKTHRFRRRSATEQGVIHCPPQCHAGVSWDQKFRDLQRTAEGLMNGFM